MTGVTRRDLRQAPRDPISCRRPLAYFEPGEAPFFTPVLPPGQGSAPWGGGVPGGGEPGWNEPGKLKGPVPTKPGSNGRPRACMCGGRGQGRGRNVPVTPARQPERIAISPPSYDTVAAKALKARDQTWPQNITHQHWSPTTRLKSSQQFLPSTGKVQDLKNSPRDFELKNRGKVGRTSPVAARRHPAPASAGVELFIGANPETCQGTTRRPSPLQSAFFRPKDALLRRPTLPLVVPAAPFRRSLARADPDTTDAPFAHPFYGNYNNSTWRRTWLGLQPGQFGRHSDEFSLMEIPPSLATPARVPRVPDSSQ
ncbi:hypothetical protein Bbelb_405200 [Branchiostoma belcheri]|nr:hypothetical protein Bbelb_405200 [Branchiostoma belcheri]